MRPPRGRGATGHRITCASPLTDLGLVQALTTQHGSLAAVRCRLILRNHPRPVGRRERAPDRTSRRIYDYFSWAGHRIIFGTRKNWTIATHETISYHHPPRWTRGLRGVSLQPDREGPDRRQDPRPRDESPGNQRHTHPTPVPSRVELHPKSDTPRHARSCLLYTS